MQQNDENYINIKNRCETEIKGVIDVVSYDSEKIVMKTCDCDLLIVGSSLSVKKLDVENKFSVVLGEIRALSFNDSKERAGKSFLKSLIK